MQNNNTHSQGTLLFDGHQLYIQREVHGRKIIANVSVQDWGLTDDNKVKIDHEGLANAEHLALCWNNYPELVEAVKDWVDYCEKQAIWDKVGQKYHKAKALLQSLEPK